MKQLKTKQLPEKDLNKAMNILDNEIGKDRVRKRDFLEKSIKNIQNILLDFI